MRGSRQIDQLVYEVYGLMDEEIRIVEEATEPRSGHPAKENLHDD
jgi:hypothetical protein